MSADEELLDDAAWQDLVDHVRGVERFVGRVSLEGLGLASALFLGADTVRPALRPKRRRRGADRRALATTEISDHAA